MYEVRTKDNGLLSITRVSLSSFDCLSRELALCPLQRFIFKFDDLHSEIINAHKECGEVFNSF